MKLMIEVSVGDFLDRLSILRIKQEHGLDVAEELSQYEKSLDQFDVIGFDHYMSLFLSINSRLWMLEDQKRKFSERTSEDYSSVAELITQLNDLRFAIKKKADSYFKSSISEKKSHS
jgi:hypothetical protein